jgi:tripartite-type tricarboxylate transporter receptor subunit TctC
MIDVIIYAVEEIFSNENTTKLAWTSNKGFGELTITYKDNGRYQIIINNMTIEINNVALVTKLSAINFDDASKESAGLHFATAGTGSTPHFVAELLNTRYGAKLIPVPYKSGSEGAAAVMGGQVAGTSEASIIALPHIKPGGKFRALATTWTKRISVYPELSTATEQGFPDLQIAHWAGIHAPVGVPPDIMDKLAAAVDVAMKSPQVTDRLKSQGIEPLGGTRASFNEFVDAERARLGATPRATK